MTIELGSHAVHVGQLQQFIFFTIQVSPMLLPSCFALSYIIKTCIWIVPFPELFFDCILNGWCPFLALIDDGLPEELIEPSQALFWPATIFPVGPIAGVFSSVMASHSSSSVICVPIIPHILKQRRANALSDSVILVSESGLEHILLLLPSLHSCNFG